MVRKIKTALFLCVFVFSYIVGAYAPVVFGAAFSRENEQPVFSIVDAQRYYMNVTTFPRGNRQVWLGFQFNITAKNVGSDAAHVDMYVYESVVNTVYESPQITQTSYGQDAEGEFSTKLRFKTWKENETLRALFDHQHLDASWVKLQFVIYRDSNYSNVVQKQVFVVYFDTLLSVSNSPFMYEYLEPYDGKWLWWGVVENMTISGRLLNTTSGNGIPNERISIFCKGRIGGEGELRWLWTSWTLVAGVQTSADGYYSYVYTPPKTRFSGSDVVYEIKVAWNQTPNYTLGFSNVYLPPRIPSNSSQVDPFVIMGGLGIVATVITIAVLLFKRKTPSIRAPAKNATTFLF